MSKLLLLGAGGHGKVLAETALSSGIYTNITFLDDRYKELGFFYDKHGYSVVGPLSQSLHPKTPEEYPVAMVSFGLSSLRLKWLDLLSSMGYHIPVLAHPTAWISRSASIGMGTVILAHATVQAGAFVGRGTICNNACSLDHDVYVGEGVHICPGVRIAGHVQIGDRSWIGIGSSVIQQVRIGSDVTVGAGAAVVSDLPDGVTALGVPARVLNTN